MSGVPKPLPRPTSHQKSPYQVDSEWYVITGFAAEGCHGRISPANAGSGEMQARILYDEGVVEIERGNCLTILPFATNSSIKLFYKEEE